MHPVAFLALDLAEDRARDAANRRRAALVTAGLPGRDRPGPAGASRPPSRS